MMTYYAILNSDSTVGWIFKSEKSVDDLEGIIAGRQYHTFTDPDLTSTETPLEGDSWEVLPDDSINIYKDYPDIFPLRIAEGETDDCFWTEDQFCLAMIDQFYNTSIQTI
jgi:hypothetical protein